MSGRKKPIGVTGRAVADTIERLRILNGLTRTALAEAVQKHGRSMPPLALSRITAYQQRVDVDDLVALAAALNTTPQALMDTTAAEEHRTRCLRWLMAEDDYRNGRKPIKPITAIQPFINSGTSTSGGAA